MSGKEKIYVTGEHPFYVVGKGWNCVKDLHTGDTLFSNSNKKLVINNLSKIKSNEDVYNFEVNGYHNYFITKSKILVHNKKIKTVKKKNLLQY